MTAVAGGLLALVTGAALLRRGRTVAVVGLAAVLAVGATVRGADLLDPEGAPDPRTAEQLAEIVEPGEVLTYVSTPTVNSLGQFYRYQLYLPDNPAVVSDAPAWETGADLVLVDAHEPAVADAGYRLAWIDPGLPARAVGGARSPPGRDGRRRRAPRHPGAREPRSGRGRRVASAPMAPDPSVIAAPREDTTDEIDVSIVLPVYNEKGHLRQEIDRIRAAMDASELSYEIIVIDDGSDDGSGEALREVEGIRLIQFLTNRGSGSARKYGTRAVAGPHRRVDRRRHVLPQRPHPRAGAGDGGLRPGGRGPHLRGGHPQGVPGAGQGVHPAGWRPTWCRPPSPTSTRACGPSGATWPCSTSASCRPGSAASPPSPSRSWPTATR